jgi:hypothetical protein
MIRQTYSESLDAMFRNMIKFTVMWRVAAILPVILVFGAFLYMKYDGSSETINRSAFDKILEQSNSQMLGELYYKGRSGEYDYFAYILNIYAPTNIRLKVTESPVSDPFPYTSEKNHWRSGQKTFISSPKTNPKSQQKPTDENPNKTAHTTAGNDLVEFGLPTPPRMA